MPHEPYQPIDCSQYDLYEIAIMRGQVLDLVWCNEQGVQQQARVKPVGLQTLNGEEFLLLMRDAQQPDSVERVRLDRIQSHN